MDMPNVFSISDMGCDSECSSYCSKSDIKDTISGENSKTDDTDDNILAYKSNVNEIYENELISEVYRWPEENIRVLNQKLH